jgi:hypothetical protein
MLVEQCRQYISFKLVEMPPYLFFNPDEKATSKRNIVAMNTLS